MGCVWVCVAGNASKEALSSVSAKKVGFLQRFSADETPTGGNSQAPMTQLSGSHLCHSTFLRSLDPRVAPSLNSIFHFTCSAFFLILDFAMVRHSSDAE